MHTDLWRRNLKRPLGIGVRIKMILERNKMGQCGLDVCICVYIAC